MLKSSLFFLSGILLPLFLLFTGIRYGIRLKFFYILHPIRTIRTMTSGKGGFSALSLALAGTLGIGNIAGVAGAILMGGAGAVFWMCISAIVAMSVKYGETYFAVKHRTIEKGEYTGGAPYYIKEAFSARVSRIFAPAFALLCIGNSLITGNFVQINAIKDILPVRPVILGGIFAISFLLVILKGTNKISSITSVIIPILTLAHIILSLYIIFTNIEHIPGIFAKILSEAFNVRAVFSGVGAFSILTAVRYGVTRGLLSNEAGCGTSPIAHADSANDPHTQGCLGIFEVHFDTVILCTLTALVILIYGEGDTTPIEWVARAYGHFIPSFGSKFIYAACIIYVFSTLISQFYYGDKSLLFITKNKIIHTSFAILFAFVCIVSPLVPSYIMWNISDVNITLLTVFNLITLNLLIRRLE